MKHRKPQRGSAVRVVEDGITVNWNDVSVLNSRPSTSARARKKAARNIGASFSASRSDPTRTFALRKQFAAVLRGQFAQLKDRIVQLIETKDAFGLTQRQVQNAEQARDERGRFASSVDALEDLPSHGKDAAKVPFPVVKDTPNASPWLDKQQFGGNEVDYVHEGKARPVPIKEVNLDDLLATQPHVFRSQLKEMQSNPPSNELPLVLKTGGKLHLQDGTHRATVAKLSGAKTMRVRLWDADEPTNNAEEQPRDELGRWTVPGHYTKDKPLYAPATAREYIAGDKITHEEYLSLTSKGRSRFAQPAASAKSADNPPAEEENTVGSGFLSRSDPHGAHVHDIVKELSAGKDKLIPLHEVRKRLTELGIADRDAQDAAVHAARKEHVTASYLEGREGTTDEEHAASIKEDGGRVGFLSLRQTRNANEMYQPFILDGRIGWFPVGMMVENANPEGCNQYKSCDGGSGDSSEPHYSMDEEFTNFDPDHWTPNQSLSVEDIRAWESYKKGWGGRDELIKKLLANKEYQSRLRMRLRQLYPRGFVTIYRGGDLRGQYVNGSVSKQTAEHFASHLTGFKSAVAGNLHAYKVPIDKVVGVGEPAENEMFFDATTLERVTVNEMVKNANDDVEQRLKDAVREARERVNTGPDYQRLFWDAEGRNAWWVSADGDDDKDVGVILDAIAAVKGVRSVSCEAETSPKHESIEWKEMTYNSEQPRDELGRFTGGELHSLASSVIKELSAKYAEPQGSEPGISSKECNEGWCSTFAHSAVRLIQQKRGREVTTAGRVNETDDVYTSRTNMDESGEGHMWVTVDGRHYDPEAPDGVDDPHELPWFSRHEGFHVERSTPLGNSFSQESCSGRLIEVPDIRQETHWTCGASAATGVLRYWGIDVDQDEVADVLGMTVERGTSPEAIVALMQLHDLEVIERQGMTVADLAAFTAKGWPVIVCVQDYMGRRDPKAEYDHGHYLTVIGVGWGYVFAQDSSLENFAGVKGGDVRGGQEANIDAPGRVMIREQDFLDAWHDEDTNGKPYVRWGCAVGPGSTGKMTVENEQLRDAIGRFAVKGSAAVAEAVANVAKFLTGPLFAKLNALSMKTCDMWVMEQAVNAQHPGSVMAGKAATFAAAKAYLTARKLTKNTVQHDEDQADHLRRALAALADVLGVPAPSAVELRQLAEKSRQEEVTDNTRFANHVDAAKLEAFQRWLRQQMDEIIRGKTQEQLWDAYIHQGWSKGAGRAFDDVRKPYAKFYEQADAAAGSVGISDFHRGSKEEFLRSSFGQPVAREKVQLMASQTFDELEGITDEMSGDMGRILTDGLVQGKSPHNVAKDMVDEVDIIRQRAEVVAQHNFMKVHNEGSLTALEQLGVERVGVAVEWTTSGLLSVCPLCAGLEGAVLTIAEARGKLPLHVGCKCCWLPANVGEDDDEQLRDKDEIDAALEDAGLDFKVGKDRPESILNIDSDLLALDELLNNVFCKTGKGGGVDPTCKKGEVRDGGRSDGQAGRGDVVKVKGAGRRVAREAGTSSDAGAGGQGAGGGAAAGEETGGHSPELKAISDRIDRYAKVFKAKGHVEAAEWMGMLKEHINNAGPEAALAALNKAKGGGDVVPVQYEGAADEPGDTKRESNFIHEYLKQAGVVLLHGGDAVDSDKPYVSSWSEKNLADQGRSGRERGEGKYIPTDQTLKDKLEESKALPGLEKSEDLSKAVGKTVTHLDKETVDKLDKEYGKNNWLIKSYGEEAYAGFGLMFPQRAKQIQSDAKAVIADARWQLKDKGYNLVRDEKGGEIIGVGKGKEVMMFGSKQFDELPKGVQTLGRQVRQAAPNEHGVRMPRSSEESLQNDYGMTLDRDEQGVPNGVTDWTGKRYKLDSKFIAKFEEQDGGAAGKALHRALERDEDRRNGFNPDPKFLVQPAFKAVGVSEADRAAGSTWETAREGRVHAVTDPNTGKASAVPYATMLGRGDSIPVVFASKDSKEMEQAVEDAINRLPASERTGQMYAPDVMKTKDGWKVIELNPSAVGGGSAWLGENPLVMDAVASHLVGRDPQHVRFIRELLESHGAKRERGRVGPEQPRREIGTTKGGTQAAAEDMKRLEQVMAGNMAEHQPRDAEGRWSNEVGAINTVTHGSLKVQYSEHATKRIDGPNIPLPNYKQHDDHSCSFVAALSAVHHFDKDVSPTDVLKAVRPTKSGGMNRRGLQDALKQLGIKAEYHNDLTLGQLRKHVEAGTPVLITVFPPDWSSDHWTVVQGFSEGRVHLSNYKSLSVEDFKNEWFDKGEGLVCRRADGH